MQVDGFWRQSPLDTIDLLTASSESWEIRVKYRHIRTTDSEAPELSLKHHSQFHKVIAWWVLEKRGLTSEVTQQRSFFARVSLLEKVVEFSTSQLQIYKWLLVLLLLSYCSIIFHIIITISFKIQLFKNVPDIDVTINVNDQIRYRPLSFCPAQRRPMAFHRILDIYCATFSVY